VRLYKEGLSGPAAPICQRWVASRLVVVFPECGCFPQATFLIVRTYALTSGRGRGIDASQICPNLAHLCLRAIVRESAFSRFRLLIRSSSSLLPCIDGRCFFSPWLHSGFVGSGPAMVAFHPPSVSAGRGYAVVARHHLVRARVQCATGTSAGRMPKKSLTAVR